MAENTTELPVLDELEIIGKNTTEKAYNPDQFINQNFLKSSKFSVRIQTTASVTSGFTEVKARDLAFLCDSVDFPGQTLTALDYRMPGRLKVKIPYLRELNEVTLSFYHSTKKPIYTFFSSWIRNASPRSTENYYFDEIVCPSIEIIQYDEVEGGLFALPTLPSQLTSKDMREYMAVKLRKCYPLAIQSMPSNWADDGFQKVSVTFFYEDLSIDNAPSAPLTFKEAFDTGGIDTLPMNAPSRPPASLDFFSNGGTGLA